MRRHQFKRKRDCLIAAIAARNKDADFDVLQRHTALETVRV